MKVRALNNFGYPASLTVRNKIRSEQRAGGRVPLEERGRIVEVVQGEEVDAPPDLLQGWLDAGLVETLTSESSSVEGGGSPSPQPSPIKGEGDEE